MIKRLNKIIILGVLLTCPLVAMDYTSLSLLGNSKISSELNKKAFNIIVKFKKEEDHKKLIKIPESDIENTQDTFFLQEIYNNKDILLKHNRSLAFGVDSFTVYSDLEDEDLLNELISTGYFDFVEVDEVVSDLSISRKKLEYYNDISTSDLSSSKYNDPLYFLQKTFDLNQEESIGLSNIDKARDNIVNNLNKKIRVAVLDSGSYKHEDVFFSQEGYDFTTITGELDSEGNYKRKSRDNDPTAEGISNSGEKCIDGHGLAVSSIINATANNGKGIIGMIPSSYIELIPARVMFCGIGEEEETLGNVSDVASAIYWVSGYSTYGVPDISRKVDIINMSIGYKNQCSKFLQDSINYAYENGISIVVAAGNDSDDMKDYSPANCENVISVGSNKVNGGMSEFSNYGEIDFSSVGEEWVLPYVDSEDSTSGNYGVWQGTSFSAPMTTGVIAMMKLKYPNLQPKEISEIIRRTSIENKISEKNSETDEITSKEDSICTSPDKGCGSGIIDAFSALTLFEDRTSVEVAEITHKYKGFNTIVLSKYLLGLDSLSSNRACDIYKARWGLLTNKYEDIEHKIYISETTEEKMTIINSNLQRVIKYPEALIAAKVNERIGVQICDGNYCGEIFEIEKPIEEIPFYCEDYIGK